MGEERKEERGKSDDAREKKRKKEKEKKRKREGKKRKRVKSRDEEERGNTFVRGESSIGHSRAQFTLLSSYVGSSSLLMGDTHSSRYSAVVFLDQLFFLIAVHY